ncbi:Alpha/Beta hydrolase fold containing protein [Parasponia andersonii]|uniref:Alpha/Beta hydrolase fold containing protein n=1 Tax=Parasponia andersonii TaxID=3476 RepID=A0A2P5BZ27_PARAD|nr:Alpha/Beta hydrolase fold containing protein [Parasponia andersonii]
MESFPEKILVAIYVTALAPNTQSPPASLLQEFLNRTSTESLVDFQLSGNNGPEKPQTVVIVGPKYLANNAYQCCQPENRELAKMMVRPSGKSQKKILGQSKGLSWCVKKMGLWMKISKDGSLRTAKLKRWRPFWEMTTW